VLVRTVYSAQTARIRKNTSNSMPLEACSSKPLLRPAPVYMLIIRWRRNEILQIFLAVTFNPLIV